MDDHARGNAEKLVGTIDEEMEGDEYPTINLDPVLTTASTYNFDFHNNFKRPDHHEIEGYQAIAACNQ